MKPGDTEKMFDHSPTSEANFIAPELHKGEAYQKSVDWWSVGIYAF
jgi:serine/threonine protein kinase